MKKALFAVFAVSPVALAFAWSFFVVPESYFGSGLLGMLFVLTVTAPIVGIIAAVIAFLQYKNGAHDAVFYILFALIAACIGFPFLRVWFYTVVGLFVG